MRSFQDTEYFEFKKGLSASEVAETICNIYGNKIISVKKYPQYLLSFNLEILSSKFPLILDDKL